MNKTARASDFRFPILHVYKRVARFIIFPIFGHKTEASYKAIRCLININLFFIFFRGSLRKRRDFFIKRFFLAIKDGFEELERCGAFVWVHKIIPFGLGDWFSPDRHDERVLASGKGGVIFCDPNEPASPDPLRGQVQAPVRI